jgi:uncharacterized protein YndB with AHSA1/START domain
MTASTANTVQKSVIVKASQEKAFRVFTEGFDSWWPREHHIGKSPMTRAIIEGRVGGRCYSEQQDGTDCPFGSILEWEPPARFVMAWQVTAQWQYEPDLAKSSEVEVRFTPQGDGTTRVDLEHRCFERMGDGWESMRTMVDGGMGWGALMGLFAAKADA